MNNYKIKVNTPEESKEAQELFFELGLRFVDVDDFEYPQWLAVTQPGGTFSNYSIGKNLWYACNPKEITLPELKDMVVLKRNDVDDATHTDQDDWKWYVSSNGDGYVWQCGNPQQLKQWDKASLDLVDLKPIEKTMKEYLIKTKEGKYHYINDSYDTCPDYVDKIEIPGGSQFAVLNGEDEIAFYDGNGLEKSHFIPSAIIWQRHTQPEPLPFNTDLEELSEPDNVNHPNHYTQGKVECIDALEAATVGKVGIEAVCVANVIKYLWRYEEKNGKEDIKKAQWYLNKLLDSID